MDLLNKRIVEQIITQAKPLTGEETAKGVMSKTTKTDSANTMNQMMQAMQDVVAKTIEARTPRDEETPSLDYYQGQDIDDTEDSIENQAQRLRDASDATFKMPTDSTDPGLMSKPDADGVQPTDGKEDKDIVRFIKDLTASESSGDPTAEITIKDGRRFAGLLQFGEARLKDYQKATKTSFTQDDFIKDEALQEKVALWHIKDIDKLIDSIENKGKYTDRNGLRAVAHLGGKTGMKKFVQSQGKENPKDELGTSLQDYYDKFKAK
mgnify:CR=1 FL=1